MVECHLAKVIVEGSNPFARSIFLFRSGSRGGYRGSVAQLVEQLTLNQRVQGSSPCTSTTLKEWKTSKTLANNGVSAFCSRSYHPLTSTVFNASNTPIVEHLDGYAWSSCRGYAGLTAKLENGEKLVARIGKMAKSIVQVTLLPKYVLLSLKLLRAMWQSARLFGNPLFVYDFEYLCGSGRRKW